MKKEMFDYWYDDFGRDLAIETCPYDYKEMEDDAWNKELRRKAKKIFSSVYNMFSNVMSYKLEPMQEEIYEKMLCLNSNINSTLGYKQFLINEIEKITNITTKMYDLYFENKIDKIFFNEMKSFYGEQLKNLKRELNNIDGLIKEIKQEKKDLESLIIN